MLWHAQQDLSLYFVLRDPCILALMPCQACMLWSLFVEENRHRSDYNVQAVHYFPEEQGHTALSSLS